MHKSPAKSTGQATNPAYGYYALAVLFVVALFNYVDRSIIAILQEPLKRDLGLSDSQLGAVTGLSFALFYTTFAIPVARLADTVVRKNLLVVVLVIWSAMTACTSLATSFLILVLCRVGVAVGESGCGPTSHALISDYFPRHRRATAIAIWGVSVPMGTILGFSFGGYLNDIVGWRDTFLIAGVLGVALAPIVWLLKEPLRGQYDSAAARLAASGPVPFKAAIGHLWRLRSFRYLVLAGALHGVTQHTIQNWNASFYVRVHGLPLADVGFYLAIVLGIGGGLGTLIGGMLSDRMGRKDVRWLAWVPAIASLMFVPVGLVQYFAADAYVSLTFGFVTAAVSTAYIAPVIATGQTLVPSNTRALTSAVLILVMGIVGLGLGPLVTGVISDVLIGSYGMESDSLRYAMSASLVFGLIAAVLFVHAARFLPSDLDASGRQDGESVGEPPHP